jgi:polyisoprenoid-binding protein YceI
VGLAGAGAGETRRWITIGGKSQVSFDASSPLGTFSGRTDSVRGEFQADPGDLRQGVAGALHIVPGALRTGDDGRDRDMWKILDIARYPEIRFTIEHVEASFPAVTERSDVLLTIKGRMLIRGVERPFEFPGRVRSGDAGLWVRGEAQLKMTDFGITPPKRLFLEMNDTVLVSFDLLLSDRP